MVLSLCVGVDTGSSPKISAETRAHDFYSKYGSVSTRLDAPIFCIGL